MIYCRYQNVYCLDPKKLGFLENVSSCKSFVNFLASILVVTESLERVYMACARGGCLWACRQTFAPSLLITFYPQAAFPCWKTIQGKNTKLHTTASGTSLANQPTKDYLSFSQILILLVLVKPLSSITWSKWIDYLAGLSASTCREAELHSTGFWQAHECTGQRCYLDSGRMFGEWEVCVCVCGWGHGGLWAFSVLM